MNCTYCDNPILAGHPSVPDQYGENGDRMHLDCAVKLQEGDELNRDLED